MTVRAFVERYPVATYFALTFSISWGVVLIVIGPGRIPGTPEQIERLFPFVLLAMYTGPAIAGPLLASLVYGRSGLRTFRSRLVTWRVSAQWYAVALLIAPVSVFTSLFALTLFSSEFLPGIVTTTDRTSLLLFGLGAGLATGFLEELGWKGFATPELLQRYGVFTSGLIVGVMWGAWHFLVLLWASDVDAGALPLVLYLPVVLFSFLPPFRVLMVWVYDRTESLLVAMVMHASLLLFWIIATPEGIGGASLVMWYLVWAAVLWVVVATVYVTTSGQLTPQPLRRDESYRRNS